MFRVLVVSALLAIGALCGSLAARRARRHLLLRRRGVHRPGVVVRYDVNADGDAYAPVVSFVDDRGVPHEFVAGLHTSLRVTPVGSATTVLHLPERPEVASLASPRQARSEILFWLFFAAASLGAAAWVQFVPRA